MGRWKNSAVTYGTYGSAAYAPVYDGGAVAVPRRGEELQRRERPKSREWAKALTRTQVEVREAGQVAPFAVVGFLAVLVFAALLLFSYVQLTVANGEMTALRSELTALQTENATLTAQYEKVFDMATIEAAVGDTMVHPTADQVVYIDLSEPDTVEVYGGGETYRGPLGALRSAGAVLGEIVEYFR